MKARRFGAILKKIREGYGLEIAQVAADIGVSASTVGRIEQGLHKSALATVEGLFRRYELNFDRQKELLDLAAEAFRSGWWIDYGDVLHDFFAVLEDEATRIRSFQSQVVPGILQTDSYARALFTDTLKPEFRHTGSIEKRVQARRLRRGILERPDPPHLHAVLAEAAIRQQVGGRDVMRTQLRHLAEMGQRENIILQVLPFTARAHAGLGGSFVIFEFDHPDDPDIVHTEDLSGSSYSETEQAVARFRLAWDSVVDAALSPGESADLISALMNKG
jgi:transcriptional regulator with XRE-family HTH domain